ncbi:hypothetical protein FMUND_427 [Fusarium mundagurra]|uniref:Uncharacterized protein n=1 Tax=Fusarium mundagurra TaxID=1567541 RepID=A0A8H5Z8R2_9HYPO|nr:hypothetical protein FMUND_427 [Fusarium mundagurra]
MTDTAVDYIEWFGVFDDVVDALSKCVGLSSAFEQHIRNEQARFIVWHDNPDYDFSVKSPWTIPHYISQNREATLCDLNGLLRYALYIIQKEKNSLKQHSSSENSIDNEGCGNDHRLIEDLVSIFTDITHSVNFLVKCSSAHGDEPCYDDTQNVGDMRSKSPDSRVDGKGSYGHDGSGCFLPDCGIDREVITKDLSHYLGGNPSVRLGYCEEDSKRWGKMKNEGKESGEGITTMRSDATTGANVTQEIPGTSQPPDCGRGEGNNREEMDIYPGEAKHKNKGNRHKKSRAELQPDHPDLHHEPITQNPAATLPNLGFSMFSTLPAIAGAINTAVNDEAKVNSAVEVSNTTAAWIFGAVAAVTNGVTAFATRQISQSKQKERYSGHFEATVKDNQDRPPSPDTSQNISGTGAETSGMKQQKPVTGSRPVVPHGTEMAASPLYVPPAILSPGLPKNTSGRGRVLRTMSNPTPGRREKTDTSRDLSSVTAEPKIVWPEVPKLQFVFLPFPPGYLSVAFLVLHPPISPKTSTNAYELNASSRA